MEKASVRSLTNQLSEDLTWLENHGRAQPELAMQAGALRLAAASVRNVIGPFLEGQGSEPLHLAVVGGAGAGKSTIANFLSGSILAESNPQAGFTRHPIAYTADTVPDNWSSYVGFLGPLRRLSSPTPANLDQDVYQVRRVPTGPEQLGLLDRVVDWDCPDMTTWAATNYAPRLLEVAGLADILVYVASDERYNDEVPTQFLRLLLQAGKTVVVVMTKMRPDDAPAFIDHFQKSVLSTMPNKAVACLAVPQLTHAQLADPVKLAGQYRIPLINQVSVFAGAAKMTRRRSVLSAMNYLKVNQAELLGVARSDLVVLEDWKSMVKQGESEFLRRYRREFLATERFPRFDEALVRLLDLLEIPGFQFFGSVLRAPFVLVKSLFHKAMQRPESPPMPERPVLEAALSGWTDSLRKEAARRASTHAVWAHIDKGFSHSLTDQIRRQFEQSWRSFQQGMNQEVDRTARAIYEDLQRHPVALNTLRGGKLAMEVGAIALSCTTLGVGHLLWWPVAAAVAAPITQGLIDILGRQYVESQRERARLRQETMVTQLLADPLAERFVDYPTSGGSPFERMQMILRRIPESVRQLDVLVQQKLKEG
jgi:hypothetical protein